MNETRGITVKVDAALHQRAKADQEARELTMSEYITLVLNEHFTEKEREIMSTRTMAFQVDEALFQRIKAHLHRTGMSQKAFVIGLIEQALSEAEAELAVEAPQEDSGEPTDSGELAEVAGDEDDPTEPDEDGAPEDGDTPE